MARGTAGPAFCSRCGKALNPGARFCAECGAGMIHPTASVPAPPPSPVSAPVPTQPAKKRKNRHWGLVLTIETVFCGVFTVFIAYAGAPSIFVGIFGIASALFFVALVGVLLTRAARRGADQQVAPTAAPIPRTGYSPDGAWWWDGTQWHAVPTEHVPAAAAP